MIKKTTQIPAVKINFMSEEIYDSITPSSDELYAVEVTDNLSIPLLTPMWLDHIANDIRWLRADTFSWQSGDVYKGVYKELSDEWDRGTPESIDGSIANFSTWKAHETLPQLNSIAYNGRLFVAVGGGSSSNTAYYSFDGYTWETSTLPATTYWSSVAYGDGVFVAIAGGGGSPTSNVAAYSTDGINWTAATLPSTNGWIKVVYGNGTFVAISGGSYQRNAAAYSTDGGATWTGATLTASDNWWDLTYGDGKFIAIASGRAAYSTDGTSWIASSSCPGAYLYRVCYGNGKYIALTNSDAQYGVNMYSEDGINWTAFSGPLQTTAVTFAYNMFVRVGGDILGASGGFLHYSYNGLDWFPIENVQSILAASRVIAGNDRFIIYDDRLTVCTAYVSPHCTFTVRRTPKGYKIVEAATADDIDTMYNNTGVAWFYILDTENKRFKLPRTKYGFTGLRTQPGNYIPESLPNITGRVFMCEDSYNVVSGAFYNGGAAPGRTTNTGGGFFVDFDASKSSDIYQDDAHVQQRATEMYLYFYVGGTGLTQGALPAQAGHTGEVLVTDGENADWKPMAVRNIGETVFSLIPLTDACLHLLDGALLDGNGSYAEFVTYMRGLSVTCPDLFISEADWQTSVTTYGVCGKFVYDSANSTLRLPKVTGIVEGTLDITALGDLVEESLPDHTHTVSAYNHYDSGHTSLFYPEVGAHLETLTTTPASDSNPVYQDGAHVQPQTIKGYYYIVVASSVKKDYVIDVDNVMTDLSYKADKSTLSESGLYITTYVNGTEWYREYFSDSTKTVRVWLEQGGKVTGTSQGQVIQINLLRPFTNANYTINATQERSGGSATSFPMIVLNSLSATQFNLCVDSGTVNDWYACGI